MPTKPEEKAPENNGEDQGNTLDPQKKYLMDQFGNLMEKVGDGFGGPLQEELIKRLEQTIADFHEEVSEMMASLKENAEKRHEKLKEIWNNPDASVEVPDNQGPNTGNAEPEGEMSEWEKKFEEENKDKKNNAKFTQEEPKKRKRSIFKRSK